MDNDRCIEIDVPAESSTHISASKVTLHYLTEGAANVIYVISSADAKNRPGDCDDKGPKKFVLRLRKDLPFLVSTQQTVHQFQAHITPLFDPAILLDHHLFRLPADLISKLNQELRLREQNAQLPGKKRSAKRIGVYLPPDEESYGILVPDLSGNEAKSRYFIEFKPKWLVQSPSAPKTARRCRNCALREMRNSEKVARGRGDSGFCPINLLSPDPQTIAVALRNIWPHASGLSQFVAAFLASVQPALDHLQKLQAKYNGVSLLDFESTSSQDIPVAMALRDCSVFMRYVYTLQEGKDEVVFDSVKFADLDLKNVTHGKLEKWAGTESRLIEGGWYDGHGTGQPDMHGPRCALDDV